MNWISKENSYLFGRSAEKKPPAWAGELNVNDELVESTDIKNNTVIGSMQSVSTLQISQTRLSNGHKSRVYEIYFKGVF